MRFLIIFLALLTGRQALAFTEMTRLGYFSCSTCHVSSAGGDVLTPYGRSLAADRLSTWSAKGEEDVPLKVSPVSPDWFLAGGDSRGIAIDSESVAGSERKVIRMQSDLAAALVLPHFVAQVQGGEAGQGTPVADQYAIRNAWAQVDYAGFSLRGGKFLPRYGLNIPQHFVNVRSELGFDDGDENLAAELSYGGEDDEVTLTRTFGGSDVLSSKDQGGTLAYYHRINGQRIGASALYAKNKLTQEVRYAAGLNGTFYLPGGLTFALAEADYQVRYAADGVPKKEAFGYLRIGTEVAQGLIPFVSAQGTIEDLALPHQKVETYGLGVNWFPRPHFELEAQWGPTLIMPAYTYVTTGYVMAHYYL